MSSTQDPLEEYKVLLSFAQDDEDYEECIRLCNAIGSMLLHEDRLHEALEYHERELETSRALRDERSQADAHAMLGTVYVRLNRFDEALQHYTEHFRFFSITELEESSKETATALLNMGTVYLERSKYFSDHEDLESALSFYDSSECAFARIGGDVAYQKRHEGVLGYQKGNILEMQGKLDDSVQSFEKCIECLSTFIRINEDKELGNAMKCLRVEALMCKFELLHQIRDRDVEETLADLRESLLDTDIDPDLQMKALSQCTSFEVSRSRYREALDLIHQFEKSSGIDHTESSKEIQLYRHSLSKIIDLRERVQEGYDELERACDLRHLMDAYTRLKKYEDAKGVAEQLSEVEPVDFRLIGFDNLEDYWRRNRRLRNVAQVCNQKMKLRGGNTLKTKLTLFEAEMGLTVFSEALPQEIQKLSKCIEACLKEAHEDALGLKRRALFLGITFFNKVGDTERATILSRRLEQNLISS